MLKVPKNRVLRKISDYTELHYEELPDFHSSTNIILVMESRIINRVRHAARWDGSVKCIQCFGWGNKKERDHLEELGKERSTGLIWVRTGVSGRLF